jgi:hypothetical protein
MVACGLEQTETPLDGPVRGYGMNAWRPGWKLVVNSVLAGIFVAFEKCSNETDALVLSAVCVFSSSNDGWIFRCLCRRSHRTLDFSLR